MATNVLTAVHTQLHLCLWQTCTAELGTWYPPLLLLTHSIPHQLTSYHPRFEGVDHWVMPCAHTQGREKYTTALFSWRSNWFFLPQSSQDSLCNLPKLLGKGGGPPLGRKQQGLRAKARFRSQGRRQQQPQPQRWTGGHRVLCASTSAWPLALSGSQALQGPVLDQVPTLRSTAAQ